ncbi:DNA cytosine methyltransferase [Halomonas koreensis]|uniref:Cytosine-specific methyltransferase n=1 Tax=Halomonas koreensis TaxID=245385 RepID=A0ABU1G5K0_9GAMM|nr:DNA cytosine methyltransferase [Halomonas koreensis]MDR5867976.1 DNA cytosine methyltransferase [Halomonas koreensis]
MRYGSVCSGIEAASVAWEPLGWTPQFFSEIEPFPSAVLAHHWPDVPNLGDMTKFKEWPDATIDVLVGGTPCQSFSVAGLRRGLDDPRGNLALTFLAIADQYRPRWVVWENVPGVLSSNGGRDFGAFLGGLVKLGYGFSYRVLDAQYFGVAQRRRRVFVVGHLGDWRRAAAVLFERESLSGNPAPRRGPGQDAAADAECSADAAGTLRASDGGSCVDQAMAGHLQVAGTLTATYAEQAGQDLATMEGGLQVQAITGDITHALNTANNGKGFSEDGTGRGVPTIAFTAKDYGADAQADLSPTLRAGGHAASHANAGVMPAICSARPGMAVRRLMPVECERLQGFPDGHTAIPYRNKAIAADGPRYKAIGNSMAVVVMEWIGRRIEQVEAIT